MAPEAIVSTVQPRWRAWAFAAAVLLAAGVVHAATRSASFHVTVTLFPPFKDTVACGQGGSGANVTVSCSGSAINGPRYMLEVYRSGTPYATVDTAMPEGTVTSWTVVKYQDRDFVEIMVGW